MKDENKLVITIGRQFGSGGCEVGTKLAHELGLDFYDKNILRMNSDESGIEESFYYLADEKAGNKLLYKIIKSLTPEKGAPSFGSDLISADNLFRFQFEVIRKLAAEENCIIMGRCADYVLEGMEGLVRIFIYADMNVRIACLMERRRITRDEAITLIKKTDKSRRNYYECYTGKRWGAGASYDVTLNSAELGLDTCVDLICSLYERKQEGDAKA